jgi:hypothetical protein
VDHCILSPEDYRDFSFLPSLTDLWLIRSDGFDESACKHVFTALASQLTSFHFIAFNQAWNAGLSQYPSLNSTVQHSILSLLDYAIINEIPRLSALVTLTLDMNIATVPDLCRALLACQGTLRHLAIQNAYNTRVYIDDEPQPLPLSLATINLRTLKIQNNFYCSHHGNIYRFFNQISDNLNGPTSSPIVFLHLNTFQQITNFSFFAHLHNLKYLALSNIASVTAEIMLSLPPLCPLEAVYLSGIAGVLGFLTRNQFRLRKILLGPNALPMENETDLRNILRHNERLEVLHIYEAAMADWSPKEAQSPLFYRPASLTHLCLPSSQGLTLDRLQDWILRIPRPEPKEPSKTQPWLTLQVNPYLPSLNIRNQSTRLHNPYTDWLVVSRDKVFQHLVEQARTRQIRLEITDGLFIGENVSIEDALTL